jgi:hypothetical protein
VKRHKLACGKRCTSDAPFFMAPQTPRFDTASNAHRIHFTTQLPSAHIRLHTGQSTNWTADDSWFDTWHKQKIFLFSSASRPNLGLT